jgi:hypothetical protein
MIVKPWWANNQRGGQNMVKHRGFFKGGSEALILVFLLGLPVQGFAAMQDVEKDKIPVAVAEKPGERAGEIAEKPAVRGGETDRPKCPPGPSCVNHTARSGDTAVDGSACTTGRVCDAPGAVCGTGNTGLCQTTQMGGGNCGCQCIMQ